MPDSFDPNKPVIFVIGPPEIYYYNHRDDPREETLHIREIIEDLDQSFNVILPYFSLSTSPDLALIKQCEPKTQYALVLAEYMECLAYCDGVYLMPGWDATMTSLILLVYLRSLNIPIVIRDETGSGWRLGHPIGRCAMEIVKGFTSSESDYLPNILTSVSSGGSNLDREMTDEAIASATTEDEQELKAWFEKEFNDGPEKGGG